MAVSRSEAPAPGQATYQDVLAAPAHQVAEIINGTMHTHPRPAPAHGEAGSNLGFGLGLPSGRGRGGPGGWRIHFEPELHLGDDIMVSALARGRRERMPELPGMACFAFAPDWVCEVLSPSTRRLDLQERRPAYPREGVDRLWLIEPADRTLEGFELRDGQRALVGLCEGRRAGEHPAVRRGNVQPGDRWP